MSSSPRYPYIGSTPATHYRAEIDGLRAIAVLAVVLYHLDVPYFAGGFVGVDVFFVISGFLITRLLVAEYAAKGSINFRHFYLRRARRLLPALFTVLGVCALVTSLLFSPLLLRDFGEALIYAVLSFSNVLFYLQSGYFDASDQHKALLHTWSLGVEEQFYLIWPALIALLAANRNRLIRVLISVGLISLIFAILLIDGHASAVFYLMPLRIYEFVMGALLVFLPCTSNGVGNKSRLLVMRNVLAGAGLGLIATASIFFNESTAFPGINALLPCMGAVLCIYFAQRNTIQRVLSVKPLVMLGLLSYSLYLVHWPLIVLYRYWLQREHLSGADQAILLTTSLLAAWLLFHFIETPMRKPTAQNRRFIRALLLTALLLIALGASMLKMNGWAWRHSDYHQLNVKLIESGVAKRGSVRWARCVKKGVEVCDVPSTTQINGLIVGDSHALDAWNAMERLYPNHDLSLSEMGGCPPYHNVAAIFPNPNAHPDLPTCLTLNGTRYDLNYLNQFDYIVVNVVRSWYTEEHLLEYLSFLKSSGQQKVLVFGYYFVLSKDLPEIVARGENVRDYIRVYDKGDDWLRERVEALGYLFISKRDAHCEAGSARLGQHTQYSHCPIFNEQGVPFTFDQHHLSYDFGAKLAEHRRTDIDAYLDLATPLAPTDTPHKGGAH